MYGSLPLASPLEKWTKKAHTYSGTRRQLAGSVTPYSFASPPRKGFARIFKNSSSLSLKLYNFWISKVKSFSEKGAQKGVPFLVYFADLFQTICLFQNRDALFRPVLFFFKIKLAYFLQLW